MHRAAGRRRRIGLRLSLVLAMSVAVLLLVVTYVLIRGGRKRANKLYEGGWDSICVINATAEFIIEKGYGYPVETEPVNPDTFTAEIGKYL